ncbi:MAG: hypothetical protein ACOC06_01110 [Halorubrum sp.]
MKDRSEPELEARDVVTSAYSSLEMLLTGERHEFDYGKLFSNVLAVVPVGTDEERQIVSGP